jgi:hypothetical protein
MFEWITKPEAWVALATLIALEVVLGVDNIIFISILAGKLPEHQRAKARQPPHGIDAVQDAQVIAIRRLRGGLGPAGGKGEGVCMAYPLEISPPDARIEVDGRAPDVSATALLLDAGSHTLVAHAPGHRAESRRVIALTGEHARITLHLTPIP